jgi:hypothetical protein
MPGQPHLPARKHHSAAYPESTDSFPGRAVYDSSNPGSADSFWMAPLSLCVRCFLLEAVAALSSNIDEVRERPGSRWNSRHHKPCRFPYTMVLESRLLTVPSSSERPPNVIPKARSFSVMI